MKTALEISIFCGLGGIVLLGTWAAFAPGLFQKGWLGELLRNTGEPRAMPNESEQLTDALLMAANARPPTRRVYHPAAEAKALEQSQKSTTMLIRDVCVAADSYIESRYTDQIGVNTYTSLGELKAAVNYLRERAPHMLIPCHVRTCMHNRRCVTAGKCIEG